MKKIKLHNGEHTLIDDSDYKLVSKFNWYKQSAGYVATCSRTTSKTKPVILMHRLINNTPDGLFTDHINRNKLDNRRSNLRTVTRSQNKANSPSYNKKKSSKFKGVYYEVHKNGDYKYWVASIQKEGKQTRIGIFKNELSAAKAYNKKAKELFGEFALLNNL